MAATARSPRVTGARPGGQLRPFWVQEYTASASQTSTGTGQAARDVTASTSSRAPWRRQAAASGSTAWRTPVDVSAWTAATSLVRAAARAGSTAAGSTARPLGTSTRASSAPWRTAISQRGSPKYPFPTTTVRSPGSIRFARQASIPALPVPGTAEVRGLSVWKTWRSISSTSSMIWRKAGSRWPITGVAMARSTRGCTMLGPGPSRIR